jgi:hypothetical protein
MVSSWERMSGNRPKMVPGNLGFENGKGATERVRGMTDTVDMVSAAVSGC